jgi:hypothetical protein
MTSNRDRLRPTLVLIAPRTRCIELSDREARTIPVPLRADENMIVRHDDVGQAKPYRCSSDDPLARGGRCESEA